MMDERHKKLYYAIDRFADDLAKKEGYRWAYKGTLYCSERDDTLRGTVRYAYTKGVEPEQYVYNIEGTLTKDGDFRDMRGGTVDRQQRGLLEQHAPARPGEG